MPHELLSVEQVARYLKLTPQEVTRLASGGKIPCHKAQGKLQFRKGDVDHWVESHMADLSDTRLAEIEEGVSAHHGFDSALMLIMPLVPPTGVVVPLAARTKDAVIRNLVTVAEKADLAYDKADLIENIRQREELCPTTMLPGLAFPHPRHPLPYDIAESFIIVGRTDSGIPFGDPSGVLTRLFFLICCKDERTHLHVLARLSRMLDEKSLPELMDAPDADTLRALLQKREEKAQG